MQSKYVNQQDKAYKHKVDTFEEELRKEIKQELGDQYVLRILDFTNLQSEIFIDMNNKIKEFIKFLTLSKAITSTKMRKIYDLIKNSNTLNKMLLQIPYLAYMVGKEDHNKRKGLGKLYIIFKDCIEKAKEDKHLYNIKKFTEALVAYQKYYEEDQK